MGPSVFISIWLLKVDFTEVILSINSLTSDAPLKARFILKTTSLAFNGVPSEKTTPSRSLNPHVSGPVADHEVANCG